MVSYIQRKATFGTNGRRMEINVFSVQRNKGTTPNRINLPGFSAEDQQAIPIQGQQDAVTVVIRVKPETTTQAFNLNTSNVTSAHGSSVTSIQDQYKFIYGEIVSNNIASVYDLYLDWLDVTFTGALLVTDQVITENKYGYEVFLVLTLTVGSNFIFNQLVGS